MTKELSASNQMRLAKFLAQAGIASRRKAEQLILDGLVKVNGKIVKEVATIVDDENKILVNDKPIAKQEKVYYLLNKPKGYICSVSDPHNSENVLQLVPKDPPVFPVGRLDKDSEGLLLLTNDGELAYQLTHPKFEVQKEYLVTIDRKINNYDLKKLLNGVELEEGLARADKVQIKKGNEFIIVIHQGWKRQIRRMLAVLHYHVISLTRISENKLKLGTLPVGKFLKLSKEEIQ
jgi:23S rRNA pseudouridine2605 synthase